ncbi:YceI family protein [Acinetobacter sichuanensis]|nr:YceI family protein [Acinetobacter sichuanensis]
MQLLYSAKSVLQGQWASPLLLAMGLMTIPLSHAADWRMDTQQANMSFKTTGMMSVEGVFPAFESRLQGDLFKPENLQIEVKIYTDQVVTGKRISDEMLKGASFFNVKKYPYATFSSNRIQIIDQQHSKVQGDLTLAGITRSIEFKVKLSKPRIDANTQIMTVYASADIVINRNNWGMTSFSGLVDPMVILHLKIPFVSTGKESP